MTRYVVTIEMSGADAVRRLRWFLKRALRDWGIKCVSTDEAPDNPVRG